MFIYDEFLYFIIHFEIKGRQKNWWVDGTELMITQVAYVPCEVIKSDITPLEFQFLRKKGMPFMGLYSGD